MVKTWSSAWFGEKRGHGVLYILPGDLTDDLLPLKVEPKPAAATRVLVGRHDVLTPEREKQIDTLVAQQKRHLSRAPDAAERAATNSGSWAAINGPLARRRPKNCLENRR